MLFSSWLRNGKRFAPAARRRTQPSPRQRAGCRPGLEALEDRWLPSGLPYPTAATVSQLIADINYADKAGGAFTANLKVNTTFDLKSVNNTTNGANGLPVIGGTKAVDLTIVGNGDAIERIANRSGSNAFRLFNVAPGDSLTLDHVTLQGGWASGSGAAGDGGAIYNQGTLTVSNGTLSGNFARYGGGIYNASGTVTVSYSTLSDIYNAGGSATVGTSTLYAIYNSGGTVTVSYSTLPSGGIDNASGTMTVSNSTVSGGSATYGGGIYNAGTLTVSNSTISGNTARFGGGIFNSGTLTLSGSTVTGNSAIHADYPWSLGDGGGIYNWGGTVTISGSIVSANTGDALMGSGGGIFNRGGTLTVENSSSITGNSASVGADVYNLGVLYLDSTSTIGILDGNPAIPI
jgi:hypothetical protein